MSNRKKRRLIERMIRKGELSEIVVNKLFPTIYFNKKLKEIPTCDKCTYTNECLTGLNDPVKCLEFLSIKPPKDRCLFCWRKTDFKFMEAFSFCIGSSPFRGDSIAEYPVCEEHYPLLLWVLHTAIHGMDEDYVRQHLIEGHGLSESELEKIPKQIQELGEEFILAIIYIDYIFKTTVEKAMIKKKATEDGYNIEHIDDLTYEIKSDVLNILLEIEKIQRRIFERLTGEKLDVPDKFEEETLISVPHIYVLSETFEKDYGFRSTASSNLNELKAELEGWKLLESLLETLPLGKIEEYIIYKPHLHAIMGNDLHTNITDGGLTDDYYQHL